jgi:hypothetical protein
MPTGIPADADPAAVEPAAGIAACARRTLAEPSAKIALKVDWEIAPALEPSLAGRLLTNVIKTGWHIATGRMNPGHLAGEGFLEPSAGRYMIDFGRWAELHTDGTTFSGPQEHALSRALRRDGPGDALRLLGLLAGTTEAHLEGTEMLRGAPCRKYTLRADADHAEEVTGLRGLRPGKKRMVELSAWIDTEHVRQVYFPNWSGKQGPDTAAVAKHLTLELWDFGTPTSGLDWTRLPELKAGPH